MELKFRIWDKKEKKMYYPNGFDETFVVQMNGVVGRFNGKTYDTVTDDVVVMLKTNILNKDLEYVYAEDKDNNGDVVSWCTKRDGWAMQIYDDNNEKLVCHCSYCEGDFDIDDELLDIIGNIYE